MSGSPRRRNLDLIEHLDNPGCLIEVNVQTGEDPHIEAVFTDMDGETSRIRLDRETAGTVGHIIGLFDRRGVREFGQLLSEGAQILAEGGQLAACAYPWCTAPHVEPDHMSKHGGEVARFSGLTVRLMLVEEPGDDPDEAWVRMSYKVAGKQRTHDVRPQAAADWSELLTAVDVAELPSIAQALYRAGVTLGASS